MKILLIFPPQWTPLSPHFALPSLLGQLKNAGFDTRILDLNIEFYNKILTRQHITESLNKAFSDQDRLLKEISKVHSASKQFHEYPEDIQNKIVKYTRIKEYKTSRQYEVENIPEIIEEAAKALKSEEYFYDPVFLIRSLNIIDTALDMASLPFYPSKITFDNYSNPLFKLNFESIKRYCFDKETNMYVDFFEEKSREIAEEEYDYIGISINSSSQIVPGLTLANMLKNHTKAHVNIGGNFFGRVVETLEKKHEFFELFADSILVEEGERPVIELAEYLSGSRKIEDVSNLVYLQNGRVMVNPKVCETQLDAMSNLCLEGFALNQYFVPEIVLPFQSSRGCYWRKCSFCDQDFGQNLNIKNIDKLINEIKEIKDKYNISHFEFIDESIAPAYVQEFADRLKSDNLNIKYFCNARLETSFSKDILQQARDSGLRMVLWGLESGSTKIMKLINKGIDIDKRIDILTDSRNSDIWNFAFIFFGFPAETTEDALKTIDLLCSNKNVVNSYGRSVFTMGKHTRLRENPSKYGITEICEVQEEFSPSYDFKTNVGMSKQELNEVIKLCTETCNKAYGNPLWAYLRYREILFLYICKYGVDWVENYKLELS